MDITKNPVIKEELLKRWKDLGFKHADIVSDAEERAPQMKITADRISRYLHDKPNPIRQESLMWLCVRWGIPVRLIVGNPVHNDKTGKWDFIIPPYDEIKALRELRKVFPKSKE